MREDQPLQIEKCDICGKLTAALKRVGCVNAEFARSILNIKREHVHSATVVQAWQHGEQKKPRCLRLLLKYFFLACC